MFERFTHDARAAVLNAQEEARALGHDEVGSEHVLLALTNPANGPRTTVEVLAAWGASYGRVRDTLIELAGSPIRLLSDEDAAALASIGIDLDVVLSRVEESFGPGALAPTAGRIRFAKPGRVTLQLALREALRLKSRAITSEHLLLGLLRAKDGMAAKILKEIGVDVAGLRGIVEASLRPAA